jgi:hypothetical protein
MNNTIDTIFDKKNCAYWNSKIFHKFVEDFKNNYTKKSVLYNQFIHILKRGKNYIEKVKLFIHKYAYIWTDDETVLSDKICHDIWKSYVANFTVEERETIVKYLMDSIKAIIDLENKETEQDSDKDKNKNSGKHKNLLLELKDAQNQIDELMCRLSALSEVYEDEKQCKTVILEKYNNLSSEYEDLVKLATYSSLVLGSKNP